MKRWMIQIMLVTLGILAGLVVLFALEDSRTILK
jgi:hypothetical protein